MFAARGGFNFTQGPGSNVDPFWNNVSFLLRVNNSGSLSNRTVADTGANSLTLTPGSLSRFSYDAPFTGMWGSVNNPSVVGAGVIMPANSVLTFAGNFTIEGWAKVPNGATQLGFAQYIVSNAAQNNGIFGRNAGATPARWSTQGYSAPTWAAINDTTKSSNDGVWRYLTLVRNGSGTNNLTFYVDGVAIGSRTVTATINYSAGNFGCGSGGVSPGAADNQFFGWIAGLRISNIARYTSNFTPPTSLFTSDSNTMLLVQGNNAAYLDISNNKYGTMQVGTGFQQSAIRKFATLNSISCGGTTTYLQLNPSTISASGDFTFETFAYVATGTTQNATSVVIQTGGATNGLRVYTNITGATNTFSIDVAGLLLNSGINSRDSTWHHLAVVRNGTGVNNVTFYVDGVSVGTLTTNTAITVNNPFIGGTSTANTQLIGNISEMRFTNGVARYTTNFTPPTQPFPTS